MLRQIENRTVATKITLRASANGKGPGTLSGYAAVYNSLSTDLGGYRERLVPGAFRAALQRGDDCRALFNHDASLVLGRTKSGTLKLREDSTGLYFDLDLPNTSTGRDVHELVQRGDVTQCSFSFRCDDDFETKEPDEDGNKMRVRNVRTLQLFDVSAVVYPAYEDTSVTAGRSLRSANYNANISRVVLCTTEEREQILQGERLKRAGRIQQVMDKEHFDEVEAWRTNRVDGRFK